MDNEKIGKFISKCRKEKNLTQSELAEKLNISDKSVSKWECGKGLPDVSLYQDICKILDISLNEFFAGEKLKPENEIKKSEENILKIMQIFTNKKKKNKLLIIIIVILLSILITITTNLLIIENLLTIIYHSLS